MSTWSVRIKTRMKELGLTQEDVAGKMNYTRGAVTHWLSGRRELPLSKFVELAAILDVDPAWLQYGGINSEEKNTKSHTYLLPIYSWEQVKKIDSDETTEYVPNFYSDMPSWYALRVKGDSMTTPTGRGKSFNEGDLLIVDPEKDVFHGAFVIVSLNGFRDVTFKQYVIDGGIRYLKPLNPQYPIVEFSDNCIIYGIVTASISSYVHQL
jgi:SOS-response transcriptional repressor LexA